MLELTLPRVPRRAMRVLCIGAHADDIEIGCGGTLLKLLARGGWEVTWAVFSASGPRAEELRVSARHFLRRAVRTQLQLHAFRDSYFPADYAAIKSAFMTLQKLQPDVIFTHQREDLHQDHRLLGELTWNAFRAHLILEYEIPKYEGGLTTPHVYVELTRGQASAKIRALLRTYVTQRSKRWFQASTFEALMHLRGIEAGARSGLAEAFHVRKLRLE
ncbi:MAG: PIG-L family deacetylase [Gammaproteobacteria bacterium]|nr:PIG-L family deacetylase [Gammaproteobacteria bacterium]